MKTGKSVPTKSKLLSLAPFLDNHGIIRLKGRIEQGEFSEDEIHPILLPKSKFTELVIKREHHKILHGGVSATLAKIRTKFWIVRGRLEVKKILNKCLVCRKYTSKPAKQVTAQQPKDRILERPPFSVTGCDFTVPVYLKSGKDSSKKAYIALFSDSSSSH